jgi:hypothetical protein
MRLAGGRLQQPYITTPATELAEAVQRSAGGAWSGIYGAAAMELPRAGIKPLVDTERMADVLLSKGMHEALAGDMSAMAALQGPAGIAKTGVSAVDYMKGQIGRSLQIDAIRASAAGVGGELFTDVPGLEKVQAFLGPLNVPKKYPASHRIWYFASILEQMGQLAPEGPVRTAQKQLLSDITSVVGGKGFTPEMKAWLGPERAAALGEQYAGWEVEMWGATEREQRNIMREMYKRKPTVKWMDTGGGRRVARMRFTGREALNLPEVHAIELATERYSATSGVSPIARGGFMIKELGEFAGGGRQAVVFPAKFQPRGQSHAMQSVIGAVSPTLSGFAPAGRGTRSGGLVVSTLMSMGSVPSAMKMGEFLQEMLAGHVRNQGLMGEFSSIIGSMAGSGREAFVRSVPAGPGGFRELAGEVVVAGEAGRAAFSKWLTTSGAGAAEAVGPIPMHVRSWADLHQETALSKLWHKGVRFTLPKARMFKIGGRDVPMAELVIPKLNVYEKMTRHYMETGEWYVPEALKRVGKVLDLAVHGEYNEGFYKEMQGMYEQFITDFGGKTGILKDVLQPRLAGSATFAYIGAQESQKLASMLGGGKALDLAEFAINPKDMERLGGTAGGDVFGLVVAYPTQGQGHVVAARYVSDIKVAEGSMASVIGTALAGRRDRDFDTVAGVINPFIRATENWDRFNALAKDMHYAQKEALRLQLGGPAAALGAVAAEAEWAKGFTAIEDFMQTTHDKWVGYRKAMMSETGAAFEEAYTKASKETPGLLGQWIARRPNLRQVKEAAVLHIRRATNTALSTGLAVNAYQAALQASKVVFDAQKFSGVVDNLLVSTATEGVNKQARIGRNLAAIMDAAQQAIIQKASASELGLMEGMEAYARDGGTSRLREVITGMVKSQTSSIEAGTSSGGLGFRLLDVTTSGRVDRARSIEATVSELQAHLTKVVRQMEAGGGHLWEGGAAARIVGYGGDVEGMTQRVSDLVAAVNADPTKQVLEKDVINLMKEMGVENPVDTHASKFIEETLEDWKDISRQTLDQSQGPGMQAKTQHPIGAASKIWNWFKAPYKEGTFHYAKRVGAVASVGLVGASIMTNLLIPRAMLPELQCIPYT